MGIDRTRSESQREWELGITGKIIDLIRDELYLDMRYLDVALSSLEWRQDDAIQTFATDGVCLYYHREHMLQVFRSNAAYLNRAYLHSVMHCLFAHLWLMGNRHPEFWHLACDIVVEYTIDHLDKPSTRRALSWNRQHLYERLETEQVSLSAAVVYRWLMSHDDWDYDVYQREFYTDSHKYWPQEQSQSAAPMPAQKQWDQISRQTQMDMEQKGAEQSAGAQSLEVALRGDRSRHSYREFLRKFAVLREEPVCDPDEFDMNFYTYGLRVYGNMPLVEPVETRETMKIREFVVVVDTSYSTSGDLVKNFLKETFSILTQSGSFFQRCQIRIIQCDDAVRSEEVVTSLDDLEAVLNRFTIVGGGGTDFRPAFSWVNDRIREGEMRELSGLLYFTDGKGVYPKKRPDYKTAFIFLQDYQMEQVPAWAMSLQMAPEELDNKKPKP